MALDRSPALPPDRRSRQAKENPRHPPTEAEEVSGCLAGVPQSSSELESKTLYGSSEPKLDDPSCACRDRGRDAPAVTRGDGVNRPRPVSAADFKALLHYRVRTMCRRCQQFTWPILPWALFPFEVSR
jgi:hypothetical protein